MKKAVSPILEATLLVGITLAGAVMVAGILPTFTLAQQRGSAVSINQLIIKQGSIAVLTAQIANTGHSAISSYTIGITGLESASGSFAAAVTVRDASSGSTLYTGSSTVSPTSISFSFSPSSSTTAGGAVGVTVVITSSAQGQSLFAVGNSYIFTVTVLSAQGSSQAVQSIVASQM